MTIIMIGNILCAHKTQDAVLVAHTSSYVFLRENSTR